MCPRVVSDARWNVCSLLSCKRDPLTNCVPLPRLFVHNLVHSRLLELHHALATMDHNWVDSICVRGYHSLVGFCFKQKYKTQSDGRIEVWANQRVRLSI